MKVTWTKFEKNNYLLTIGDNKAGDLFYTGKSRKDIIKNLQADFKRDKAAELRRLKRLEDTINNLTGKNSNICECGNKILKNGNVCRECASIMS